MRDLSSPVLSLFPAATFVGRVQSVDNAICFVYRNGNVCLVAVHTGNRSTLHTFNEESPETATMLARQFIWEIARLPIAEWENN
jgi:hypothetical protein